MLTDVDVGGGVGVVSCCLVLRCVVSCLCRVVFRCCDLPWFAF